MLLFVYKVNNNIVAFWLKLLYQLKQKRVISSLAWGTSITFVIQVSGTVLKYFSQLLLARWMGTNAFGEYSYAFTWGTLLSVIAGFGFTIGVLKFLPVFLGAQDWPAIRGFIQRIRQIVAITGVALTISGILAVILLFDISKTEKQTLLLGLLLIPFLAMVMLQTEMIRAMQNVVVAYLPPMLLQPTLLTGSSFLLMIIIGGLSSTQSMVITILVIMIICVVQGVGINYLLPKEVKTAKPRFDTSNWVRVAFPLFLVSVASIVLNQADVIMVGLLLGTTEAGVYFAVTKTATLVSFILVAVNALTAPKIAEFHSLGKHDSLQNLVSTATKWMFWPSSVITVFIVLMGKYILKLFGADFVEGYWSLVILAFGQLINSSVGPVGNLMNLTGFQNESARVFIVSAIISIILNLVCIGRWGLLGAAFATSTTTILWNVWLSILVRARLKITTFGVRL